LPGHCVPASRMDLLLRAIFFLSILPVIFAQYNYGGSGGSNSGSSSSSSSSSASAPASTASGVHGVDVGENGLAYTPNTVNASVGDTVLFNFHPINHSVVQSTFGQPCQPQSNGIFSGFMPVSSGEGNLTFTITINDTQPIWLYCAQTEGSHCQSGMAMVINPPSSGQNTLNAYMNAAKNTTISTAPAVVQGGVVSSNQSPSSSGSTSSTGSASSSSATPKSQASNSMPRSWVSLVVGAIFAGLWAWAIM